MPGLDTVPGIENDPTYCVGLKARLWEECLALILVSLGYNIAKPSVSGTPESRVYTVLLGGF